MIGQQRQDEIQKDNTPVSIKVDEKNARIKELEDRVKELDNNWKRALADYQNLVKRSEVEVISAASYGNRSLLIKFLEIFDHLEEAQKHLKDKGLELIILQFNNILKTEDVVEIEALGKVFDPIFHECIEMRPGEKDKIVTEIIRKGYLYKDRVLRPAKVIVEVKQK